MATPATAKTNARQNFPPAQEHSAKEVPLSHRVTPRFPGVLSKRDEERKETKRKMDINNERARQLMQKQEHQWKPTHVV